MTYFSLFTLCYHHSVSSDAIIGCVVHLTTSDTGNTTKPDMRPEWHWQYELDDLVSICRRTCRTSCWECPEFNHSNSSALMLMSNQWFRHTLLKHTNVNIQLYIYIYKSSILLSLVISIIDNKWCHVILTYCTHSPCVSTQLNFIQTFWQRRWIQQSL